MRSTKAWEWFLIFAQLVGVLLFTGMILTCHECLLRYYTTP